MDYHCKIPETEAPSENVEEHREEEDRIKESIMAYIPDETGDCFEDDCRMEERREKAENSFFP